jgi:hypothetical protein
MSKSEPGPDKTPEPYVLTLTRMLMISPQRFRESSLLPSHPLLLFIITLFLFYFLLEFLLSTVTHFFQYFQR